MNGEDRLAAASEQLAAQDTTGSGSEAQEEQGSAKPSQATRIVELAEERFRLGRDPGGDLFAVAKIGPPLVHMLRGAGTSLRAALADAYAQEYGAAPSTTALAGALLVLEGRARQAEPERLELRVAEHAGSVVLDLGDETGRAVVVRPGNGWKVVASPPVLFRRTALTAALPVPERGGSVEELRELVHVADEAWPLAVGWLLIALLPSVPAPVLFFRGAQGAGKSSAARLLSRLVDPSAAQLRSAPRDASEWVMSATGSRVVPLDNLSRIAEWLGDALCRVVTGDGLARRALYTDSDVVVFAFRRSVVLTAIAVEGVRGDLADRLLPVELERIPEEERRTEAELEAAFAAAHPRILGALLELLGEVLAVLPDTRPERLPRLADAGRLFAALDRVTGWESFEAFCGIAGRLAFEVVEDDLVASAVVDLIDERGGSWSGSTTELLARLTPEKPPKGWPETVQALTGRLTRAEEALRQVGVAIERTKIGKSRSRRLTITRTKGEPKSASASSASSATSWLSGKERDEGVGRGADEPHVQADEGSDLVLPSSAPSSAPQTGSTPAIARQADEADEGEPPLFTCEGEQEPSGPPPAWIAAAASAGEDESA